MNKENKIALILGAGPAGLALAYELIELKTGIIPIIVDKLPNVGGLSRTVYFDGLGVDIGGHRLYTNNSYIQSIWDKFLPHQNAPSIDDILASREVNYPNQGLDPEKNEDVMLIRKRFSSIIHNHLFFDYPIKLNLETLSKLGFKTSFKAGLSYIKSIFQKREEKTLEDFFINRFGYELYSIFFKDYTKKVWGKGADELSNEWGKERIRKLSLFKTILNAILLNIKFLNFKKETSLIDEFYYPKYGCSQLWNLMADYIQNNGGKFYLNSEFVDFETKDKTIINVKIKDKNNNIKTLNANYFISSIPISELIKGLDAPYDIKQNAINLPYRDYILTGFYPDDFNLENTTTYKTINNKAPQCWFYLQEKDATAARIQVMNNWSPYLVGNCKKNYLISLEYFTNENEKLWQMQDDEIIELSKNECEKYNLFKKENILKTIVVREKKAYPSYFGTYKNIDKIKDFLSTYENLYIIGRNGQHKYNNMDEAMLNGIEAARKIKAKQV